MNKKNKIFAVILVAVSISMYAGFKPNDNAIEEIKYSMLMQQASWNNGNLEAFMDSYWKSDSLMFVGKNGPQYGWQQTLVNYKKSYPDTTTMGKLQFTNIKITKLSHQYVYVFGKWDLQRSKGNISGFYTLIWEYIDNRWLIISDHSS